MPSEAEIDALIERLSQFEGRDWETTACYNGLRLEAARFLAALRDERDRLKSGNRYAQLEQQARARVRELEQKLERARVALEPFTQIDMSYTDGIGDEALVLENDGRNLVLGDFHRARATLAEIGQRE